MNCEPNPQEMITLKHPGPVALARATASDATLSTPFACTVESGEDLFATVETAMARDGLMTATFTLVQGNIARLTIMTGGVATAHSPVGFCGPHVIGGPVRIVSGTGICGLDEAGRRFCHCHAVFADTAGRLVGGHLMLGKTIADASGAEVEIHPVHNAAFRRAIDPETGFAIFHPVAM